MSSLGTFALFMLQIPGLDAPDLTLMEQLQQSWVDGGWMMWPIGASFVLGIIVAIWKLIEFAIKGSRTKGYLRQVDTLLAEGRIEEALALSRETNAPAARILAAGLEHHNESIDRVTKAIENVGLLEMASLERGLVWLATVSTVAPLLGFLGTVIGMIEAFAAIELAGEVEATLVAGGIKIALVTTAAGLIVAIPISIAHNYFVTRVDNMVVDMEESAQKMMDALHEAKLV